LEEFKQLIKVGDSAGIEKALERAKGEREKLSLSAQVRV
jgi:prephenate dehydrogenase